MSINDLRVRVLEQDETAHFHINLLMLEGVGYEVTWSRTDNSERVVHRLRVTRSLSEARHEYEQQLRKLCLIEAKFALGLPIDDSTTMKGE